jgi:copper chaperone CopZ
MLSSTFTVLFATIGNGSFTLFLSAMDLTLNLSGLHCQACVGRVTKALAPLCREVEVELAPAQVANVRGATVPPQALLEAVARAGAYTAQVSEADVLQSAAASATEGVKISASIPVKATVVSSPIVAAQNARFSEQIAEKSWTTYFPLALLTAYLVFVPALAQWNAPAFDGAAWMRHFMAAFFLAFSFFKLLNLRAFADAYAGYDLLAAKWHGWGYIYPFVELALGIAYLINFKPTLTNAVTFIVMAFSLLGVLRAVLSKQKIKCACLGAVFNLPMSTVTIVEDALMAAMALWMLR